VCLDDSGASLRHSGARLDDSGASLRHSGVRLDDSGASLHHSGVCLDDSGASLRHSGVRLDDSGVSLHRSGAASWAGQPPAARRAAHPAGSGGAGVGGMEKTCSMAVRRIFPEFRC
jgi:hypothetical protein